jgi:hypothetical protein
MSSVPCILFADRDGWRLGSAGDDAAPGAGVALAPPDAPPDALAAALRAAGYAGGPVVLALPSEACLCAAVATADLPARHRHQAMTYRLEERLPVSAEEVVADFIPARAGGALGVCVRRSSLRPMLDTLRLAGVHVRAACPAVLLALQESAQRRGPAADGTANGDGPELILWADGADVDAFVIEPDGTPRAWSVTPHDPQDLGLLVGMLSLGGPGGAPRPRRVTACGLSPAALARVRETFDGGGGTNGSAGADEADGVAAAPAVMVRALAASAARAVLARRLLPWVDFVEAGAANGSASGRAFAQARGPLAWLAASAAVLAVSASAALFWRAARYDRLAGAYDARQQDVFRRAFPGQAPPRDVRSRLASEARRLDDAGGAAAAAGGSPGSADGLTVLRDLIAALPADLRFSVSELRLDASAGRFTLRGEARSRADAEGVADALRAGFQVDPPRTALPAVGVGGGGGGGVAFDVTGAVAGTRPAGAADAVGVSLGASAGGDR